MDKPETVLAEAPLPPTLPGTHPELRALLDGEREVYDRGFGAEFYAGGAGDEPRCHRAGMAAVKRKRAGKEKRHGETSCPW